MEISAIRSAICVTEDNPLLIEQAVKRMFTTILEKNSLTEKDIAFILITQTGDLTSRNPAGALRNAGFCQSVPLFCSQELEIKGMLEKVIRFLLVLKKDLKNPVHVYLDGAEKLRPDLALK